MCLARDTNSPETDWKLRKRVPSEPSHKADFGSEQCDTQRLYNLLPNYRLLGSQLSEADQESPRARAKPGTELGI